VLCHTLLGFCKVFFWCLDGGMIYNYVLILVITPVCTINNKGEKQRNGVNTCVKDATAPLPSRLDKCCLCTIVKCVEL
jgi:hypothetical protein